MDHDPDRPNTKAFPHGSLPRQGKARAYDLPPNEIWDHFTLGLSGHIYDRKTGMAYMHNRYYHPRLGHFLNPDFRLPDLYDPGSHKHPYAYANDNPVMFWDPDGLHSEAGVIKAFTEKYGMMSKP